MSDSVAIRDQAPMVELLVGAVATIAQAIRTGDYAGANERITAAIQYIEHVELTSKGSSEEEAGLFSEYRDFFSLMASFIGAVSLWMTRNPGNAQSQFIRTISAAQTLMARRLLPDDFLLEVSSILTASKVSSITCGAQEKQLRADFHGAMLELSRAEAVILSEVARVGLDYETLKSGSFDFSALTQHELNGLNAIVRVWVENFAAGAMLMGGVSSITREFDDAKRFFSTGSSILDVGHKFASYLDDTQMQSIVLLYKHLVEAYEKFTSALELQDRRQWDLSIEGFKGARSSFLEASAQALLTPIPTAPTVNEVLHNLAVAIIPQSIKACEREREIWRQVERLSNADVAAKTAQQKYEDEKSEIIKSLARGANINIQNNAEFLSVIQNSVSINVSILDRTLEQLSEIVKDTAGLPDDKRDAINEKISQARTLDDVAKKFSIVKSIVSDFGDMVGSVSGLAPAAIAVAGVLAKLFA